MLQKQAVDISFAKGLDTKTDPWRIGLGNFLSLVNSRFTKAGQLLKRNGYGSLTSVTGDTPSYLTTFNGNLTSIGTKLNAYVQGTNQWINKGSLVPVGVDVMSLIRSNANQTIADSVTASNGLCCVVYYETVPSGRNQVSVAKYAIVDSITGQIITSPTVIPVSSGTVTLSRVFVLGNYFLIVFVNTITGTAHLQYVAINITNPTTVGTNTDLSSNYLATFQSSFDGYVANNIFYFAFNATDGGGATRVGALSSSLVLGSQVVISGKTSEVVSVSADQTGNTPVIYVSFYSTGTQNGYVAAYNSGLSQVLAPTLFVSATSLVAISSAAQNQGVTIFYEVNNTYSYDTNIRTDFIDSISCSQTGTVGSASTIRRSVGLASKAFIINGKIYVLAEYNTLFVSSGAQASLQPTYFLIDSLGNHYAKLAYENANPTYPNGWANVSIINGQAQICYLFQDQIQAVNKGTDLTAGTPISPVYAQVGINLVKFTIGTNALNSAEIGTNLNVSGGILWTYDGLTPNENGFHLYPENIELNGDQVTGNMIAQQYFYQVTYEWQDNQGNLIRSAPSVPITFTILTPPATFTANTNSSFQLSGVSSFTNLQVGQKLTGAGIPANTFIVSLNSGGGTITINNMATATATGVTITPMATSAVFLNIPTLRLTYKIANPVKIVIYRWSLAQQVYYQTTFITTPVFNDPTIDSVSWSDRQSDAQILGNNILYTTGGVIENIGAPAAKAVTLFDDRLWLIDSEDQNLLWFSKQVIETTPVEMSDLLTVFVAPSIGSEGSTGKITAIAPMDDKLIIFKQNAIYYMNGTGPDNTGSNSQYSQIIFITSSVGCSNQNSIVIMPEGIMFQSDKGIWLLGRDLSTNYIGAPVEAFNGINVNSAVSVPGTTEVRFTLADGTSLMYDYFYSQWVEDKGASAISSTLYQNLHTIVNSLGNVSQETPGLYQDSGNPVLMSFTTGWINLAGLQGYQRAYFFYLLGQYYSPHKLNLQIAYDYNSSPTQATVISPTNFSGAYGQVNPYSQNQFGGPGNVEWWRVFLAQQRCSSFQISLQEIYDSSFGVAPGAGFTLSGLNLVVGVKKGFRPMANAQSVGGGQNRG